MNKNSLSVLAGLIGLGLLRNRTGAKNTDSISMDLTVDVSGIHNESQLRDFEVLLSGLSRMDEYINWTYEDEEEVDVLIIGSEPEQEALESIVSYLFDPDGIQGDLYCEMRYDISNEWILQSYARRFSWTELELIESTDNAIKYKITVDLNMIFKIWELDWRYRDARVRSSDFEDYLKKQIASVLDYVYSIVFQSEENFSQYDKPPYLIDNVYIPIYLRASKVWGSSESIRRF
jgi:hypothetical protein